MKKNYVVFTFIVAFLIGFFVAPTETVVKSENAEKFVELKEIDDKIILLDSEAFTKSSEAITAILNGEEAKLVSINNELSQKVTERQELFLQRTAVLNELELKWE